MYDYVEARLVPRRDNSPAIKKHMIQAARNFLKDSCFRSDHALGAEILFFVWYLKKELTMEELEQVVGGDAGSYLKAIGSALSIGWMLYRRREPLDEYPVLIKVKHDNWFQFLEEHNADFDLNLKESIPCQGHRLLLSVHVIVSLNAFFCNSV